MQSTLVLTIAWRRCRSPTWLADDLVPRGRALWSFSLTLFLSDLPLSLCLPPSLPLSLWFHHRGVWYLWLHSSCAETGSATGSGSRSATGTVPLEWAWGHGRWQWQWHSSGGGWQGGGGRYVNKPFWRVLRALPTTGKFTISSFTWPIVRNVYAMLLVILYSNTHTHIWRRQQQQPFLQAAQMIAICAAIEANPNTWSEQIVISLNSKRISHPLRLFPLTDSQRAAC